MGSAQKAPVPHILAGCSALAQSKFLERDNSALKVLFFELLQDLKLIDSVPPWYSPVQPKSLYDSEDVQAYWDIPVFAEYNEFKAKRADAKIVDHQAKKVTTLEMSCPWIQNRGKKDEEKALKYGPLHRELEKHSKGYRITHYNIIIDILGGWSSSMKVSLTQLLVMQRGVKENAELYHLQYFKTLPKLLLVEHSTNLILAMKDIYIPFKSCERGLRTSTDLDI